MKGPHELATHADFLANFGTEAQCRTYIEKTRWPEGFVCRFCEAKGTPYRFKGRPLLLRCRACLRDTTLTAGTLYHRSRWPLTRIFLAHFLLSRHPNLSVSEFCRQVGLRPVGSSYVVGARYHSMITGRSRHRP